MEEEMSAAYVQCKVLPGLFEGELYVLINGSSLAYVNKDNMRLGVSPDRSTEVDGRVLAYIISRRDDQSLVEVPGEAVVGGLRTWVPNAMLTPA